ncbi:hypothetical protein ABRZ80_09140 [Vibrio vulnificus]|uniref:hypothetical protein n=1 Tax=Vibrio vulnificus TaxID=672 RepID=UPI000C7C7908|nr:hypothetical protein [Vibrio vulnificus]AUJ35960.1 hypothetical protein BWZ32_14525 [Vibrio vulnificus]EGR7952433.1 hypothetical protein [Vibrio vulnificus]EJY4610881.1 hypothetical protein [Vibrio vulnificus]MBN8103811.1 hypothetical protein [Vibrio vulnificus]MDS1843835.1 hypothetical protein [Vibrio vulnificus]
MIDNVYYRVISESLCEEIISYLDKEKKLALGFIDRINNPKDVEKIVLDQIQLIESITLDSIVLSDEKREKLESKKREFISVLIGKL